jgi:glyoxylase-like metal-dependent hydrolase (beta-lactamase superfamily II)
MPGLYRIDRRTLLADLGKGAIAVAILGFAACSDDGKGKDAAGTSTTAAKNDATSAPGSSDDAAPKKGDLSYQQVSLGFVSAYVLVRGGEAAVVDTGVAGSAPKIEDGLKAAGVDWSDVAHVILTHYHPDHAGSIGDVLTSATGATAYAGEKDLARITAPRPLVAVKDDDEIFGLQMVATPGHTAGHFSVFDPTGGLLVAGDALTNLGSLTGSNPQFTEDMAAANESVKKLAQLKKLDTIVFGHGDPLTDDAGTKLRTFADSL